MCGYDRKLYFRPGILVVGQFLLTHYRDLHPLEIGISRDVSKVRAGQKAYVTADAFGKQKFWGQVVRVGQQLGPKNVRTDEPTERVDTKILETLVELAPARNCPTACAWTPSSSPTVAK